VSNYLQGFNFKCYFKSGKEHVVLDALSQLASLTLSAKSPELDFNHLPGYYYMSAHIPSPHQAAVYNFTVTLAEMSPQFLADLIISYSTDDFYNKHLIPMISTNDMLKENAATLKFF
jgi:hypothetical protein